MPACSRTPADILKGTLLWLAVAVCGALPGPALAACETVPEHLAIDLAEGEERAAAAQVRDAVGQLEASASDPDETHRIVSALAALRDRLLARTQDATKEAVSTFVNYVAFCVVDRSPTLAKHEQRLFLNQLARHLSKN